MPSKNRREVDEQEQASMAKLEEQRPVARALRIPLRRDLYREIPY